MKIGQKAIVKEKFSIDHYGIHWVDRMNPTVGMEGTIIDIDRGIPVVFFKDLSDKFFFSPDVLEVLNV